MKSRNSFTSVACEAIQGGKTNAEVLRILRDRFPQEDWEKRKGYPTFYRSDLRRKGVLSAAAQRLEGVRATRGKNDLIDPAPKHVRVEVGRDGRVVIPVAYRRVLGLEEGGQALMAVERDEVRLIGRDAAIRRVQSLVAKYVPAGTSLTDELLAERRVEAAREDGERR